MHATSLNRETMVSQLLLVTADDRLALTLCVAVIVHAMLILGVSFAPEPPAQARSRGLEVTLVTLRAEHAPDKPDLLAQANSEGGGNTAEPVRPAAPLVAPLPGTSLALAAASLPAPPAARMELAPPLDPLPLAQARQPAQETKPAPRPELLVKPTPIAKLPVTAAALVQSAPAATPAAVPTAAQLITRSFALASLHAEVQQKLEMKATRPRMKFVSASTQEYTYAAYMEAWRVKVERIGNLNYPDEARKRKLSGSLLLDVALMPDGAVLEIIVRRTSGHRVLDDAAVRIVELAGPYAPFPAEIRREVDILHITRTWKFLSSEEFLAQ